MNSKWQINRVGLLDFWYYDEEEFDFHFIQRNNLPHISLHLHLMECFITRKIPHIPYSTSHPKLPERYR